MGGVRLRFSFALLAGLCLLLPGKGEAQYRRRSTTSTRTGGGKTDQFGMPDFSGVIKSFDGKILTLEQGESNALDFHCSRKTHYFDGDKKLASSAIKAGLTVTVTSKQAPDASLDAVTVRLEKVKPEAAAATAPTQ